MLEIKEGKIIHYMNHNNRILRGKVIAKVGRYYKISNSNFLVSSDRIFKNDEQVTKFFNLTKGWNKPES